MEYLLLSQPLKTNRFHQELHFSIDPELLTAARMIVPNHYANAAHFGSRRSDAYQALAHAAQTLRKMQDSPRLRTLLEQHKQNLIKDFNNYLHCLQVQSSFNERIVQSLISALLSVGCGQEVADSLEQYHARFCAGNAEGTEEGPRLPALDFPELYIKAGDKALFQDENLPLALQYYRLSILSWSNPENETVQLSDSWHGKVLDYLALTSSLRYEAPIFLSSQNEALFFAFRRVLSQFEEDTLNPEFVQTAEAFFQVFSEFLESSRSRNTPSGDLDTMRDAFILAWSVKIHCLLDTLCALHMDKPALRSRLSAHVLQSVLAMNIPHCPVKPLWAYAVNYQSKKNISDELLQFAHILELIIKIRTELRIQSSELKKDTAYYTSLDTLMYMMPPECKNELDIGKLSVMNIAYMNDPNEGNILRKYLASSSEAPGSAQRKSSWFPFVFAKCFTSRIDDLPMWEMYGNRAEGCCIIIDWPKTLAAVEEIPLYRICYLKKTPDGYSYAKTHNPDIRKDSDFVRWLTDLQDACRKIKDPDAKSFLDDLLERIAYLFKDSSYHYEKEVRILYTFSESSSEFKETPGKYPMLFVSTDFPIYIKEIIIGPKFKELSLRLPYIQQQIEKMCRVTRAIRPQITLSEIEYR